MLAEEEIPVNFVSYLDDIPNLPRMPAKIRNMRLETDEVLDELPEVGQEVTRAYHLVRGAPPGQDGQKLHRNLYRRENTYPTW